MAIQLQITGLDMQWQRWDQYIYESQLLKYFENFHPASYIQVSKSG